MYVRFAEISALLNACKFRFWVIQEPHCKAEEEERPEEKPSRNVYICNIYCARLK